MSPVRKISRAIKAGRGDLVITGSIMGGGAVSKAVAERAQRDTVSMTTEAARTIHDDLDRVRSRGIRIISDEEARKLKDTETITTIEFGDLFPSRLKVLLDEIGVGPDFSAVAGAVQDHGVCPEGINPLDFRHMVMRERIEENPCPDSLFFAYQEIPTFLTRMKATADLLSRTACKKVFMMDTGIAAIVGASLDPQVRSCTHYIVADIGNSHTLAAVMSEGQLGGFWEYHTDSITPQRMEDLLVRLGNGDLRHRDVVAEGGHGAYIRTVPGFEQVEKMVVPGPRRHEIMDGTSLPYVEGAPFGDNMMTGTAGLLECIVRRENLGNLLMCLR